MKTFINCNAIINETLQKKKQKTVNKTKVISLVKSS